MLYSCSIASPVGRLCALANQRALLGLWMEGQRYFAEGYSLPAEQEPNELLLRVRRWTELYFAGARPTPHELPLAPQGSPFRQRVWRALAEIPYGETMSYGALAQKLGSSARAVGGAVGHNPLALIIPCHRVVGSKGELTGYAGGTERKLWLLKHEQPQD